MKYNKENRLVDELVELAKNGECDGIEIGKFVGKDDGVDAQKLVDNLSDRARQERVMDIVSKIDTAKVGDRIMATVRRKRNRTLVKRISAFTGAAAIIAISLLLIDNSRVDSEVVIASQAENIVSHAVPMLVAGDRTYKLNSGSDIKKVSAEIITATDNKLVYEKAEKSVIAENKSEYNTLYVPHKYTYELTLSDGTNVFINAGSSITYPVNFDGKNREVTLVGEAYFEVAKDEKPFIVKANNSFIKVLGTEFNVNARKEEETKTVLIEGSVGVGLTVDNSSEYNIVSTITPNTMVIVNEVNGGIETVEVDGKHYISWIGSHFNFTDTPFNYVIESLEGWYGVDILYDEKMFSNVEVSVTMLKSNSVGEALKFMEQVVAMSVYLTAEGNYRVERKEW